MEGQLFVFDNFKVVFNLVLCLFLMQKKSTFQVLQDYLRHNKDGGDPDIKLQLQNIKDLVEEFSSNMGSETSMR